MKEFCKMILNDTLRVFYLIFRYPFAWICSICSIVYSQWICCRFRNRNIHFRPFVNVTTGERYISVGRGTGFGRSAVVTAWAKDCSGKHPRMEIGERCSFGDYIHLTAMNEVIIGNDVLTGRWVTITDNSHGDTDFESLSLPPTARSLVSKGPVVIGNKVWIGDKVTILPGVTIGDCSVIGANSVVVNDIPPYSVACGIPARVLKQVITGGGK